MANIMLTEACNLKCSYCFVNDLVKNKKSKKHIEMDDFKEIVDFITKTESNIGLHGGEPTLHPNIKEILEYVIRDKKIKGVNFMTNGICLDKVIDQVCHPKIHILVNLNSPKDIGKENYEKVIKNLDKLYFERYHNRITLGINMYKKDFEYKYMIDALKRYKMNHVRATTVSPNSDIMRKNNYLEYIKKLKPSVLEFFKELFELEITHGFDCQGNIIPPCVYTEKEKEFIKKVNERNKEKGFSEIIFPFCHLHTEFTVNKEAVMCLTLSKQEKVKISDFNNVNEIKNYYLNKYEIFAHTIPIDEKCRNCIHMKTMQCVGGCIGYRINEINQARKICESIRKI
jgi:sulfatase maturation enzyme AslB (radical SAM superfamily)